MVTHEERKHLSGDPIDTAQPRCYSCRHYTNFRCSKHGAVVRGFGEQKGWLYWPAEYNPWQIACHQGWEKRC